MEGHTKKDSALKEQLCQRIRCKGASETDNDDNLYGSRNEIPNESTNSIDCSTRPPLPPSNFNTPLLSSSSLSSTSSSSVSSPIAIVPPISALHALVNNSSTSYNGNEPIFQKSKFLNKQPVNNTTIMLPLPNPAVNSYLTKAISTPSIIDKMGQENGGVQKHAIVATNETNGMCVLVEDILKDFYKQFAFR